MAARKQTATPTTIQVQIAPAPMTPLNLRLGTVYAPVTPDRTFAGFACLEVEPNVFAISGYEAQGTVAELWRGHSLGEAFFRLCRTLGMTRQGP
jgi:hypothetical protein